MNGGGGSGKTTRAINTLRSKNPLVFTPTHRLAKEMRDIKKVQSQTYHSFFRWSGQKEWTEERTGHKFIPKVIIWDEVCTVPENILKTFLDWLQKRNVQIVCCGDHGQPPPIAGPSPHNWLKEHADYYEEVQTDYRAKCPQLKELKENIRLKPDREQFQIMRNVLPLCNPWSRLTQKWNPQHLILTSRKAVRDRIQRSLFEIHTKHFPDHSVPLIYRPRDSRKQNCEVCIPGQEQKEVLVLNDVVDVSLQTAKELLEKKYSIILEDPQKKQEKQKDNVFDWDLGYAMTVHSSQGLTIKDPQKIWIIDDNMCWSNLVYLAVSRVEYLHQLERSYPPSENYGGPICIDGNQMLRNIGRKLQSYTSSDKCKGLQCNLEIKDILTLKDSQKNHCAACNIEMLWCYDPNDTRQFSVDRIDNTMGHVRDNIRLTCLECNRNRGAATNV